MELLIPIMKFSSWNDSFENVHLKKDKSFQEFDINIDLNTIASECELSEYLVDILVGEGIDNMQTNKNMESVANDDLKLFAISLMKGNGATDAQIAKKIGISTKQFKRWVKESPKIAEAYINGVQDVVTKLAGKMATRAFGYDYEETKQIIMGDVKKGSAAVENQRTVKIEKITKHMAPDVGAQIFLLTNLDSENWKNQRNIKGDIDANVDGKVDMAEVIVAAYNKRKAEKEGVSKDGSKNKAEG